MRILLIAFFAVSLVACGGGGFSGNRASAPLLEPAANANITTPGPRASKIYVSNETVLIFNADATGNSKPVRKIPINPNGEVAFDELGNLYATYFDPKTGADCNCVVVFAAAGCASLDPIRRIAGPATLLNNPETVAVDSAGYLYVLNAFAPVLGRSIVTVYAPGANGDVAPVRTFTVPAVDSKDIAIDSERRLLYITQSRSAGEPGEIDVFSADATGDAVPVHIISGPHTALENINGIGLDRFGSLYVAIAVTPTSPNGSILQFAPNADGDASPLRSIQSADTKLHSPFDVAVDLSGDIYVLNGGIPGSILVFAANAHGDALPIQTIEGPDTGLSTGGSIAVR